jgi:hypothetical protein
MEVRDLHDIAALLRTKKHLVLIEQEDGLAPGEEKKPTPLLRPEPRSSSPYPSHYIY